MSATATTAKNATGKPVELGRYETEHGTRVLVGQRVDGEVQITDRPLPHRPGRPYFVDADIESKVELAGLVADYRRQAERFGCCPMSREAIDQLIEDSKEASVS